MSVNSVYVPDEKSIDSEPVSVASVIQVFDVLWEYVDDRGSYVKASDIVDDVSLREQTVGQAILFMKADAGCPLDVVEWNEGTTGSRTYYIERGEER